MRDLEDADAQLEELRRVKDTLEHDNRRLRDEVKYLEDSNARNKGTRPISGGGGLGDSTGAVMILRKENEALKQENRNLKERMSQMAMELDAAV